jgi:TolB-like protein/class 3 adenylate cyclase/Tfp pilus assembly protein PilF
MDTADMKRRLAAVLVADVEGYSRRMADDAAATVSALDAARDVFRREVGARGGHIVDMVGDSVLAVFGLATGAVEAALAVQRAVALQGSGPGDQPGLSFRIGVHVGELIEKPDGSVYGDGVNIAARLQAQAPAGGLCVSEAVHDTLVSHLAVGAVSGGALPLKNIRRPVAAWFIWAEGDAVGEQAARRMVHSWRAARRRRHAAWLGSSVAAGALLVAGVWALAPGVPRGEWLQGGWRQGGAVAAMPSIAVLPFANLDSDADASNFADGMHEDLLTQLASMRDLKVISRTSVLDYRGTRKNLRQVGKELGAGLVVEGSVRRAGGTVRVTAQLIDARTDQHLWAGRYDRELRDLFGIQAELAVEIARALRVTLTPADQARIAARPTSDLKAYESYLQAQAMRDRAQGTERVFAELVPRIELLTDAVKRDPGFALAWAALAAEHALAYATAWDKTAQRQTLARDALNRALALQPRDATVKIAEGQVWRMAFSDYERAARAFESVLAQTPYHVEALNGLSGVLAFQDRDAESAALLERALVVEPNNFRALRSMMRHHRRYRQYARAEQLQQQLIALRPDDLSLQAEYQQTGYYRTGTWTAYDAWRAGQPPGVERRLGMVLKMDLKRAAARRDWPQVVRLVETDAADSRAALTDNQAMMLRQVALALVHNVQGDRGKAVIHARRAIEWIDREIAHAPLDAFSWSLRSQMAAVLGDSARAKADFNRSLEVARQEGGGAAAASMRSDALALHALLGELDQAQAEAARLVRLPGMYVHDMTVSLELAPLWDTPAFRALIADPASNAPVPLTAGR